MLYYFQLIKSFLINNKILISSVILLIKTFTCPSNEFNSQKHYQTSFSVKDNKKVFLGQNFEAKKS